MPRISVGQMDAVRANLDANLARIAQVVAAAAAQGAQIVVLPEMVTSAYFVGDVLDRVAEPVPGPTTHRLGEIAKANRVYIACGLPERDAQRFYNSAVLLSPAGALAGRYRKVHLWADDNKYFTPGEQPAIVQTEHGPVALTICYDLMFPEYIRALVLGGARMILNCTDWVTPDPRIDLLGWSGRVTSALASTRAIENRVIVAMANRVGVEGSFTSLGYSCICNQLGAIVALIEQGEGVATVSVDLNPAAADERMAERRARLEHYRRWESEAHVLSRAP